MLGSEKVVEKGFGTTSNVIDIRLWGHIKTEKLGFFSLFKLKSNLLDVIMTSKFSPKP